MKIVISIFLVVAAAFSAPVSNSNGEDSLAPEQIHLSLDENLNIVVTWNTKAEAQQSLIQYGKTETQLNGTAKGVQTKFVDPSSKVYTQYIHKVTVTGLAPKTKYFYRCGDGKNWSKVYYFNTLPKDNDWSARFATYGDFGYYNAQSLPRLIKESQDGHFDAILHIGDLGYDLIDNNSTRGDEYMRLIEPMAAIVPYMTCPGNHENHYNFSNYVARFSMPNQKSMFYSMNIGPVHFVSINTEYYYYVQYGIDQIMNQYHWLKADLENANKPENRAKQPWIITMGHRPMYCSNNDFDDCTFYHRDMVRVGIPVLHWYGLEKIMYDNGVDLELWAHEHSYERLWPVYDLKVYNGSYNEPYRNPGAPVHVVTGSAGCQEKHDPFDPENFPPWTAFRSIDYGYSRMTVHNATHLTFEQVSDDKGGQVIDSFTIIKNSHSGYKKQ